jgi:lipopolysaccharide export system protein LptA
MTPTKALLSVLFAAGLSSLAAPAVAQWALDPDAPLDISAPEQSNYSTQTCVLELKGDVQITQDRVRLIAGSITGRQAKRAGACGAWTRLEADRDVYYVTPDEKVRADHAVYDVSGKTVTFTGGVVVVRGQNVAAADKAVINLKTNDFTLTGHTRSIVYPERSGQ